MSCLSFDASRFSVPSQLLFLFCCINFILSPVLALQVVPGSNCTAACTEHFLRTNTTSSDITCYDQDYNSTVAGNSFRDCVTCEFDSLTFDHQTNQTDLGWALYNLRYATAWCIFDYPRSKVQEASTPCNQTCGSIATALETNLLTPNKSQPYDYCQDPRFTFDAASCASCYSHIPNQKLISNFLGTLRTACQSQPPPTGYLPISPIQVFSFTTPSPPDPSCTSSNQSPQNHDEGGSGLNWNAKVAISIAVPVAALLILSLLCLLFYITRKNRRRPQRHLTKSSSHRSHRSNHPQHPKAPPAHLRYNHKYPPHPGHRKTLSADTATSEKDGAHANTFNRPFSFPHHTSSIHHGINYPAPLRTRTTPSPHPTFTTHASARTPTLAHQPPTTTSSTSPRAKLPSHLTATTSSPTSVPLTSHSLSPPPLNVAPRPPPPPRGLVSWEQRGIQHARTKSLRDSMRRSGESGRTAGTERVKVAMQVPRDANISEWKEETRTPTPVTIMERDEEGEEDRGGFRRAERDVERKREKEVEEGKGRKGVETEEEEEWKKRVGSI